MDLKTTVAGEVRTNWWHWAVHAIGLTTTVLVAKFNAQKRTFGSRDDTVRKGGASPKPAGSLSDPALELENIAMSQLTNFLHNLAKTFDYIVEGAPAADQAQLQNASSAVSAAATAVEQALPALAVAAANAALALIPANAPFVGLEDEFIDATVSALLAKKSTAGATGSSSSSTTGTTTATAVQATSNLPLSAS